MADRSCSKTQALTAAFPQAGSKLAVLAHGLCLNDLHWNRAGHDHGAVLARELGYTPLYLHYNSGLHTSINGRTLAVLLEVLLEQWPHRIEDLVIVAHSMGGLVARSACHYGAAAGHGWPRRLTKLAFLGTPHHGAPLERSGNWVTVILDATPYAAPVRPAGKDPQRRHHRPALRQRAGRALAGPRSVRTCARHPAIRAAAERRAKLRDGRHDRQEARRSPRSSPGRWTRPGEQRPGASRRIPPLAGNSAVAAVDRLRHRATWICSAGRKSPISSCGGSDPRPHRSSSDPVRTNARVRRRILRSLEEGAGRAGSISSCAPTARLDSRIPPEITRMCAAGFPSRRYSAQVFRTEEQARSEARRRVAWLAVG